MEPAEHPVSETTGQRTLRDTHHGHATKSRKHSKAVSKLEDASAKRGRPRLHAPDQSNTDRRRIQIRLAQRAYRSRKESTITALKTRVACLEDIVDLMSKTFLDFNDQVVDSGLVSSRSPLGSHLKAATKHFLELAQDAYEDHDREALSRSAGACSSDKALSSDKSDAAGDDGSQSEQCQLDLGNENSVSLTAFGERDIVLSDLHNAPIEVQSLPVSVPSDSSTWAQGPASQISSHHANMHPPTSQFWDPKDLRYQAATPSPYTYSFQETTFARRLHRATLETAFHLLTNKSVAAAEAEVQRIFCLTFTFLTRERLVSQVQKQLRRKAGDPFEPLASPFVSLGGASLHYPRRDCNGNPLPPYNTIAAEDFIGSRSPLSPAYLVDSPRTFSSTQELINALGFTGTWLDPHDVEEYLKGSGLYLDAGSSFIDVDPSVAQNLKSLPSVPSEGRHTDHSSSNTTTLSTENAIPTPQGPSSTTSLSRYPHPPPHQQSTTLFYHTGSPSLFDINKFLSLLVQKAICLGRAPGYKKSDVDSAVLESLVEGY